MKLKPTNRVDFFDRPTYRDQNGRLFVDVNLDPDNPYIHYTSAEGEPDFPVSSYEIVESFDD